MRETEEFVGRISCCDADLNMCKYMKTFRLDRERQIDKERNREIFMKYIVRKKEFLGRLSCYDADLNMFRFMKTLCLDRERQIDKDRGRNIHEIERERERERKSLWED